VYLSTKLASRGCKGGILATPDQIAAIDLRKETIKMDDRKALLDALQPVYIS
jgi:hypothetical protein